MLLLAGLFEAESQKIKSMSTSISGCLEIVVALSRLLIALGSLLERWTGIWVRVPGKQEKLTTGLGLLHTIIAIP